MFFSSFFFFPIGLDKYVNKQYPLCQDSFIIVFESADKNGAIFFIVMRTSGFLFDLETKFLL